jgi:hypothetical protein
MLRYLGIDADTVDPGQKSGGLGPLQLPPLDRRVDRAADPLVARRDELGGVLDEGHPQTGACAHLRDARPHQPAADHADVPDVRRIHDLRSFRIRGMCP